METNCHFNDEYITCVYFLDLQGPPRIGFVGTGTTLNKTTDGGAHGQKYGAKEITLYITLPIFASKIA